MPIFSVSIVPAIEIVPEVFISQIGIMVLGGAIALPNTGEGKN
jgi:hypothetical protein